MVLEILGKAIAYSLPPQFANKYIVAIILFLGFFLFSEACLFLAENLFMLGAKKTKTKLDDYLIERTQKPISLLLLFIGMKLGVEYLNFANGFGHTMSKLTMSLILIAIAWIIIAVATSFIDVWGKHISRKTKSTMDDALIPLFRQTVKVLGVIFAVLYVVQTWGFNITSLLAGVGIAGLAIGFAVKDTLGNIFGGISLILDKTFGVGQKIKLSDGTLGLITDVGIRATRIKTFDNEVVIVPNGALSTMTIKNYNMPDPVARVIVDFGVAYGSNIKKVKKVAIKEIKKIPELLDEPTPFIRFDNMGDSSLNMKAYFWVTDTSVAWSSKEVATELIYDALNKNKINIPFPQMDVHIKKK